MRCTFVRIVTRKILLLSNSLHGMYGVRLEIWMTLDVWIPVASRSWIAGNDLSARSTARDFLMCDPGD